MANEAMSINNLYRLALMIPNTKELRDTIYRYNDSIINDELKDMDKNGTMNEKTQELYQEIWYYVYKIQPRTDHDKTFYDKLVDKLEQLSELRLQRFVYLQSRLYPLLWVIIIVGFLFAIICFYYLNTEKLKIQLIFDSIVIAMILLNIWLISELDTPFSGYLKVSPKAYQVVEHRISIMGDYIKRYEQMDREKSHDR